MQAMGRSEWAVTTVVTVATHTVAGIGVDVGRSLKVKRETQAQMHTKRYRNKSLEMVAI
jgi:hypothetical protein